MDDLIAFLRARLDEREQTALAGQDGWENVGVVVSAGADGVPFVAEDNVVDHIVANDPVWVLADVASKRRIVEWCHSMDPYPGMGGLLAGEARKILRLLALPYAGHADYREEWRLE